tara:strand:+ start:767 stop:955 length:189 start_codon:yes stop_codon:yes gene_type:complete
VEQDYEKKDIKESPEVKAVAPKSDVPEGWQYYIKRSKHCVRSPEGVLAKFGTRQEALDHANG